MASFFARNKTVWLHISFWCVYLSFHVYQINVFQRRMEVFDWSKATLLITVQFALTVIMAYVNYFLLLPRVLASKKWLSYLLEFTAVFSVVIISRVSLQRFIIDGYTRQERYFYSSNFVVQAIVITLFITIFIAFLKFVSDWFEFEAKKKEVENEKLTAELTFLKAQINPHFLFNTLNNLYYLAYSKSPNTTEVISKLSLVMRYMIYDSNFPKVRLAKEIEYMENYMELEKLRLNDQTTVTFKVTGNTEEVQIAPLILITFLENAFKHGISNSSTGSWIRVKLNVEGKQLTYVVENSKSGGQPPASSEKSGFGLANVKRRLDLLYGDKYSLQIDDLPTEHRVELKLDLK